MKKLHITLIALLTAISAMAETTLNIYDHVSFYDGYLVANIPDDAPDQGCTRLYTYLNTKPLTDEQLSAIGEHLTMNVRVHAVCDNYDRIGSVNLALIPKGQQAYQVNYDASDPLRIEIARFITPFMDKNKEPATVPYTSSLDYLSNVLRDRELRERYDFWLELMIFGVPYAAHQEIAGCAGCNEVFQGSLDLVTDDSPAPLIDSDVLVPITIRTADWRSDRGLNNYNEACTDELGKTIKTYTYTVPADCADGRLVLVMSNHGAGDFGEEYTRRMHYVYADGDLKLEFKPGRESCEPFRQFNTQVNGIYGYRPMTDRQWQQFSNWCPGDVIDNRYIELGAVTAGEHTVTIEVPKAAFYGKDGYFPVSLFFQGDTKGRLPLGYERPITVDDYTSTVTVVDRQAVVDAPTGIELVELYTLSGQLLNIARPTTLATRAVMDISAVDSGVYVLAVTTALSTEAHKIAF